jgi:hypothetical protein
MIESDLYSHLNTSVGASVGGRIYPLRAPEKFTAPVIVYQRISQEPINTITKGSGDMLSIMQIDVYASTYAEAKSIEDAIYDAAMTWGNPKGTWFEDSLDMLEETVTPSLYRVSQRFKFHHVK